MTAIEDSAAPRASTATRDPRALFDRLHRASRADPFPPLALRLDRLARIHRLTQAYATRFVEAISADFGHRPRQVTEIADLMVVRGAVALARKRLPRWMKPQRSATPLSLQPGRGHVQAQPLGVVGIVAPWNYPYQLAMSPAVSAIAAGNRVMIKPSESMPRFSALLQEAVAAHFADDEMVVVTGDAAVARSFVALPFDHLLFTGSTAVGREVAVAAAANLTPVTLELGGKSPAILNADCDLAVAIPRLMAAKLFNAGQTCVAPDYLLVHRSLMSAVPDALRAATAMLHPSIAGNPDYATIVDARHVARLQALIDDAVACGARVVPLHAETETRDRRLPPFAIVDTDERMAVMREEIFGPLLPIVPFTDIDDAIAYVNARDRPLALYWFGRDARDRDAVLTRVVCGGVTIDDCMFHVVHDGLPFGGVGASGHGRYHGIHGFRTFSHEKPVFAQSRWTGTGLLSPPYGRLFERLSKWL